MKTLLLVLTLSAATLAACGKVPMRAAQSDDVHRESEPSTGQTGGTPVLTKQEVGAILGSAVISVEGRPGDMNYKTAVIGLETTVGVESQDDSVEAMSGARKATGMLGGTPEVVPNLGEEAFFGAMSILYVRKGNFMITITPPNLQLVAASAAYSKVTDAKMGSVEQAKAMQDLVAVEKTDPLNAGLKGGNDVQGALAVVAASSKKQGTTNEAQARAMGLALAMKLLSTI
jgi:hypothetical protein